MNSLSSIEEKRLRDIIAKNPVDTAARFRLAVLLDEHRVVKEAREHYETILEIDPGHNSAFCRLNNLIGSPEDTSATLPYEITPDSERPERSLFLFHEQSWDVMHKESRMVLIPVSQKYFSSGLYLNTWSRNMARRELERQGFSCSGVLQLKKEDEDYCFPLTVELGKNFASIFPVLVQKIPLLRERILRESGVLISSPVLHLSSSCEENRYRILQGSRLLAQGGMKLPWLFFIPQNPGASQTGGINCCDETLGVAGQWIPPESGDSSLESGGIAFDTVTHVMEILHRVITQNLSTLFGEKKTTRLIQFLKSRHPHFPWHAVESHYSLSELAGLVQYYIETGGKISHGIDLFSLLATCTGETKNPCLIRKYILDSLVSHEEVLQARQRGDLYAFSLPAETEEKILSFFYESEEEHFLLNLTPVLTEIIKSSMKIRAGGKVPALICHPDTRPFLRECLLPHTADLPIVTDSEITMEQPPYCVSEDEYSTAENGMLTFFCLSGEDLPIKGKKSLRVASLIGEGRRSFLSLEGAALYDGSRDALLRYQERGFSLEGIYSFLYQEGRDSIEAAPEFQQSPLITVQAGRDIINTLRQDREFKSMVRFLRDTIEREYGISPPEIHFLHDSEKEPMEYTLSIGSEIKETETIRHFPGSPVQIQHMKTPRVNITDHLLNHLLALIEHNLGALIDFELIEKFIQHAGEDLPALSFKKLDRNKVLEVLKLLVRERVPIRAQTAIIQEIAEHADDEASLIAEKTRLILHRDITSHVIDRFGKIIGMNLDADMEIILSTSLLMDPCMISPSSPTKEKEYLAQLILKGYEASPARKIRFPIFCSKSLRQSLSDMTRHLLPDVLFIAREELTGNSIEYAGIIEPPKGFFKFIIDETLKQGILSEYDAEETRTLEALRKCVTTPAPEKRSAESEKRGEECAPFSMRLSTALFEHVQGDEEQTDFFGFILFIREWMERSCCREIPRVNVLVDESLGEDGLSISHEEYGEASFTVAPGSWLTITGKKKGERFLGTLYGRQSASAPLNRSDSLSCGEVILLHLFTALRNFSHRFDALTSVERRALDGEQKRGMQPEEFRALYKELLKTGAHPLAIEDAITAASREVELLGKEARRAHFISHALPPTISQFYLNGLRIPAVVLHEEMEAFISGYMKEISGDLLISHTPPSLMRLTALITQALKKLIEGGFSPVIITRKADPGLLSALVERNCPNVHIITAAALPPDATFECFVSLSEEFQSLCDRSGETHGEELTWYSTVADYHLFRALLLDYGGDCSGAASWYSRILENYPYHPTALWRQAFCLQRTGEQEQAQSLRQKALHHFAELPFSESGYFNPGDERAEYEYDHQMECLRKKTNPGVTELRAGYCAYSVGNKTEAEKLLRRALRTQKYDDEAHTTLAHVLADREAYSEAFKHYGQALGLNPWNREAQRGMAMILSEESRHDQSWSMYRTLLSSDTQNAGLLSDFAYVCQDREDYQTLKRVSDAILKDDPENTTALMMRSKAYHQMGFYDLEIADLNEGLRIEPTDILLHRTLGDIFWSAGLFEEARGHYLELFTYEEEKAHTLFHRIRVLLSLGDLVTSKKLLLQAFQEDGTLESSTLYHLMGEIELMMGHLAGAREYFQKAHTINSSTIIYQLNLADTMLLSGEHEKAEKLLRRILKYDPSSVIAYPKLAWLAAAKGNTGEARSLLKTAMGWAPGYLELYTTYFSLPSAPGEMELWREYFSEKSSLDPLNHGPHFCLGLVHTLLGDTREALKEFERAYLLLPELPLTVEYLCRILIMENDRERALVILRVALKKIVRSGRLCFLEGAIWKLLGNSARAKECFAKAATFDPLYPHASLARAHLCLLEGKREEGESNALKALTYNTFFGPALMFIAGMKENTQEREILTRKAKEFNALEVWGLESLQ